MSRVNELLREVIAGEVLLLKDPAIGFVTITGVDTAPDLSKAKVFYSVLGTEEEKLGTQAALERAAPHLRSQLASQVRLKHIPKLEFTLDSAIERGLRIEALLREVKADDDDV